MGSAGYHHLSTLFQEAAVVRGRVGGEFPLAAQQEYLYRGPPRRQVTGGDETVSTVVPLGGDYGDLLAGAQAEEISRLLGHAPAGSLHEFEGGNAALYRRPVQGGHLVGKDRSHGPDPLLTAWAMATAISLVWDTLTRISSTPLIDATSQAWPDSSIYGFPPSSASISTSSHVNPLSPVPRALQAASLAAKQAA